MMYSNFDYPHLWGFGIGAMLGLGIFTIALFVALIALKGYSLWIASKRNEPVWFIILLVVNTAGILELIYLYFVANRFGSFGKNQENLHEHSHKKEHESHNR